MKVVICLFCIVLIFLFIDGEAYCCGKENAVKEHFYIVEWKKIKINLLGVFNLYVRKRKYIEYFSGVV